MKKIIAAAAGLMVSGSLVSTAVAAVEFSGDARARYYFEDNYNSKGSGANDHWNSRIRLKIKGTTAGGAFAVAKIRVQNDAWGGSGLTNDGGSEVDFYEAYVGVPMGNFLLTAGRQNLSVTSGFMNDVYIDNIRTSWTSNDTTITGFYGIIDSEQYTDGSYNDSENRLYGVIVNQKIADWDLTAALAYADNDLGIQGDIIEDGVMATIAATGKIGPVAITAEIGMQEDGLSPTDSNYKEAPKTGDTGFGGYVSAGMDFNTVNVTALTGYAADGFMFDEPVGFVMIGGDNQITPGKLSHIGNYDGTAVDTFFGGVKTSYQATENLNLNFNLAYASLEAVNSGDVLGMNGEDSADAFEVSAQLGYTINEGTVVYARAGYLDIDVEEDPTIGAGVSLELKF